MKILAINPGSTSTKIGLIENGKLEKEFSISHSAEELSEFQTSISQKEFRSRIVKDFLNKNSIKTDELAAVAGRGAPIKPLQSGIYEINEKMLHDLEFNVKADHPSILGAVIAHEIAKENNIPAFIADPVSVDEFDEIARLSGIPEIPRVSLGHALNIKAVAKRFENETGIKYEEHNFIILHLGGGISITAHRKGKMVDVNNANDDGPFSPERSGGLPAGQLVKMCFSGKYSSAKELLNYLTKKGGLLAYLGSTHVGDLVKRINEPEVAKIINAMIYQIAKETGKMATVLKGKVDYIIVTGGIAHNNYVMGKLEEYCKFIAPLKIYPGENELQALGEAVHRVLNNQERSKIYE